MKGNYKLKTFEGLSNEEFENLEGVNFTLSRLGEGIVTIKFTDLTVFEHKVFNNLREVISEDNEYVYPEKYVIDCLNSGKAISVIFEKCSGLAALNLFKKINLENAIFNRVKFSAKSARYRLGHETLDTRPRVKKSLIVKNSVIYNCLEYAEPQNNQLLFSGTDIHIEDSLIQAEVALLGKVKVISTNIVDTSEENHVCIIQDSCVKKVALTPKFTIIISSTVANSILRGFIYVLKSNINTTDFSQTESDKYSFSIMYSNVCTAYLREIKTKAKYVHTREIAHLHNLQISWYKANITNNLFSGMCLNGESFTPGEWEYLVSQNIFPTRQGELLYHPKRGRTFDTSQMYDIGLKLLDTHITNLQVKNPLKLVRILFKYRYISYNTAKSILKAVGLPEKLNLKALLDYREFAKTIAMFQGENTESLDLLDRVTYTLTLSRNKHVVIPAIIPLEYTCSGETLAAKNGKPIKADILKDIYTNWYFSAALGAYIRRNYLTTYSTALSRMIGSAYGVSLAKIHHIVKVPIKEDGSLYRRPFSNIDNQEEYRLNGTCIQKVVINTDIITEYHSNCKDNFIGRPYKNMYVGVEIEVEYKDVSAKKTTLRALQSLQKNTLFRDKFVLERDGSLNNGFELITQPHSLEDIKETLKIINEIPNVVAEDTCGVHVHVSKKDVNADIHCFVFNALGVFNSNWLTSFSERSKFRYCQKFNTVSRNKLTIDSMSWFSYSSDKYGMINLGKESTVEFRLFAGSTDYNRIVACVEFSLAYTLIVKKLVNELKEALSCSRNELERKALYLDYKDRLEVLQKFPTKNLKELLIEEATENSFTTLLRELKKY